MIHKPPATGIPFLNAALRWAYRTMKANSIMMPAEGWTQTPDGLMPPPPVNPSAPYLFPFKFSRANSGGTNGLLIRYGTVNGTIPILNGSALSSTTSENFLATWSDAGTTDTGKVYFDCLTDDSDEWTFTLTSITIGWDADGTLPSDTGAGTATCHRYFAIGTDAPAGFYNYYYSNLGLIRFGQSAATYELYAT